jgi:hypothetical protein
MKPARVLDHARREIHPGYVESAFGEVGSPFRARSRRRGQARARARCRRPQTRRSPPRGHRRTGPGRHPSPREITRGPSGPGRRSLRVRTSGFFGPGLPAQTSPAPATSPVPSLTWSITGADTGRWSGSVKPSGKPRRRCRASPASSARTLTPSPPVSPCPLADGHIFSQGKHDVIPHPLASSVLGRMLACADIMRQCHLPGCADDHTGWPTQCH